LIWWSRARVKLWVAIVLPALLLRALIPIGFMPMFGPSFSVSLMLCEGYAPIAPTAMDMSMDMPMDMPMRGSSDHSRGSDPGPGGSHLPDHQDHSKCPYGASPTFALVVPWTPSLVTAQRSQEPPAAAPQVSHFGLSPRAQSPRGPPLEV
jgi:hypothetical protein